MECQERALPTPCGESGLEGELSCGLWESCMAERIITTLSSPHLATQQYEAVSIPASKQFLLSAPGLPPTVLAALLSLPEPPTSECHSAQSLPLCLSSISIQPLGESLQVSSFQYQL